MNWDRTKYVGPKNKPVHHRKYIIPRVKDNVGSIMFGASGFWFADTATADIGRRVSSSTTDFAPLGDPGKGRKSPCKEGNPA